MKYHWTVFEGKRSHPKRYLQRWLTVGHVRRYVKWEERKREREKERERKKKFSLTT